MPALDLAPLYSTFTIRDKAARLIAFAPNAVQRRLIDQVEADYRDDKPTRVIVLKARQMGVSTCIQAIQFSMAVAFPNTNCVVVAHTADSSEHLFSMSKLMYETWELQAEFPTRYSTRREMTLEKQRSSIRVQTADKPSVGRSRTISFLHASELAFWRAPRDTMIGYAQAVPHLPGTAIFIESTANGLGNFFEEQWTAAESGESEYTPLFFPWFEHHEYIPCFGEGCRNGSCAKCRKATKGLKPKDSEELELTKMGASKAHLAFRRWAIPNLCYGDTDYWLQEYPHTPEAAFIAKGVNAFNPVYLKECFQAKTPKRGKLIRGRDLGSVEFVEDPKGPLRIYAQPSSDPAWGRYFVGADPCHGTADGDYAAAQVINRNTKEQVAVWHGRINPMSFGEELAKLGAWYNYATVAPEIQGGGAGTVATLAHIYPNIWQHRHPDRWPGQDRTKALGFLGSWQRKQWMIAKLAQMIEAGEITLHDAPTFRELKSYSFYGSSGWGDVFGPSSRDDHDDLVAALAICVLCESTEDPISPYPETLPEDRYPNLSAGGVIYGERVQREESEWAVT